MGREYFTHRPRLNEQALYVSSAPSLPNPNNPKNNNLVSKMLFLGSVATFRKGVRAVQMVGRAST